MITIIGRNAAIEGKI